MGHLGSYYTSKRIYYDYEITLIWGSKGSDEIDGVRFDPAKSDFADPNFYKALALGGLYYEEFAAICSLSEMQRKPFKSLSHDDLNYVRGLLPLVKGSNFNLSDFGIESSDIIEWELRINKILSDTDKTQIASRSGYVYLLQSDKGFYKIGHTKNPNDRLKTFNVKLPFDVDYTCLIQCDDMRDTEKRLHEKFASKRVGGEWFNLDQVDVDYIKSLTGGR